MERIKARKMLDDFEVSMFPHVKDEERRDKYRKTYRKAYPKKKRKNVSTKEMAFELKRLLGG